MKESERVVPIKMTPRLEVYWCFHAWVLYCSLCILYCFLKHTCCSYFIRVIHFYQTTRALFPKTLSWNEEQEIEMYTVQ